MIQLLEVELFKMIEMTASAVKIDIFNEILQSSLVNIDTFRSEVRGKQGAPLADSKVWTIHSPARLDVSTGQSAEKFEGDYYVGDLIKTSSSPQTRFYIGESAELNLAFSPSRGDHAVPKRYVDSIVNPLYSQVSSALLGSSRTFAYAYIYDPAKANLNVSDSNIRFASANASEYFNFSNNSVIFLKDGVYKVTGNFAGDSFSGTTGEIAFNYNSFNQNRIVLGGSKTGSMQVLLRVIANDKLYWNLSAATVTGASVGITVERIGD